MNTNHPAPTDRLRRPIRDLRISVTDRCNFRCTYCMPKEIFGDDYAFMPKSELLTFEEIERLTRLFASIGVKKIRLTGGEPLLRRGMPDLVSRIMKVDGVEDVGLTTNGLLLGANAQPLHDAGLRRLNVSLDALDPELFGRLNGRGIDSAQILRQIDQARQVGFEVKVNMVVQKGANDGEILPMAAYFKERGITLRFIEFMDVGNDNGWSFKRVVTKKEIFDRLQAVHELEPVDPDYFGEVASRYRYKGTDTEVGFITSVSESFCSSCTRARLSSNGIFYTCLFASSGFDLRAMLRGGAGDEEILGAIVDVWESRSDRYSDERTEQTAKNRKKINMSYIGG
ncbi:GTP 3',8-cyclase MoaA [Saccharibacillus alkalitolerans]|uniref:GTP 3',8-cyclase n=1 Tax=Saccharibacillus alkalitolerans TaxID=2705290 RepID=A0ABX0F2G4_9BACL|nr:GTP 3',8-cyclase MoaA [Saccharibacillus alkalitolerans]NGZ74660.1 GTP 3',8-cyclase MoaA [Saccharibacillus alkalitolerans]